MRWLWFLILGAAGLVFGLFDDWPAISLISTAILVLTGLMYVWSRFVLRGLTFSRSLPVSLSVGEKIEEEVRLQNLSLLGKLYVEIEDQSSLVEHNARRVVSLAPRMGRKWTVESVAKKRGTHTIGPVTLRSSDPLGFFRREARIPGVSTLTVFPLTMALPGYLPASLIQTGGGQLHRRSQVPTAAVGGVRDYVIGDSINVISWTATARAGRLMTKEFEVDPTSDAWIILDIEHSPAPDRSNLDSLESIDWLGNELEYRIMLASSLTNRLLEVGRSVGLILNSEHTLRITPERSDRQFKRIQEHLAAIGESTTQPLAELLVATSFQFHANTAVLVITSRPEPELAGILSAMKRRRISSEVFFVNPDEHGLDQSANILEMLVSTGVPCIELTRFDQPTAVLRSNHHSVRYLA